MTEPLGQPLSEEELAALAAQRQHEQDVEYGQFVATQDIYHDGVIAYPNGAKVPASNVARYAYDKQGMVDKTEVAAAAPAGNASTDEWRAHAVSLGATEEEVADLKRDELRDKYGTSGEPPEPAAEATE